LKATRHYKTIFRVDYAPSLDFYDLLFSVGASIKGYPDWETSGLAVKLRNLEEHCTLYIGYDNFYYDGDLQGKAGEDERIADALLTLTKALAKEKYRRLGLRRKYLYPVEMNFGELLQLLRQKFLTPEATAIFPPMRDVGCVVDFTESAGMGRVNFGPAKEDELVKLLEFRKDNFKEDQWKDRLEDAPAVSLYADLDYFRTDIPANELAAVYDSARSFHQRMMERLVVYIFGIGV